MSAGYDMARRDLEQTRAERDAAQAEVARLTALLYEIGAYFGVPGAHIEAAIESRDAKDVLAPYLSPDSTEPPNREQWTDALGFNPWRSPDSRPMTVTESDAYLEGFRDALSPTSTESEPHSKWCPACIDEAALSPTSSEEHEVGCGDADDPSGMCGCS